MVTHSNGRGLREEPDEVEAQFSAGGERYAGRDHEHDDRETLVGVLDAEGPRDEQDGHRRERL